MNLDTNKTLPTMYMLPLGKLLPRPHRVKRSNLPQNWTFSKLLNSRCCESSSTLSLVSYMMHTSVNMTYFFMKLFFVLIDISFLSMYREVLGRSQGGYLNSETPSTSTELSINLYSLSIYNMCSVLFHRIVH